MAKPNLDLMKKDSEALIKSSREAYAKRPDLEDLDDFIDQSIIPNIERISANPLLALTGSCSGHSGGPFVSMVFQDEKVRDAYQRRFRERMPLLDWQAADEYRLPFFDQFPDWGVTEEWGVGLPEPGVMSGVEFWRQATALLTDEAFIRGIQER